MARKIEEDIMKLIRCIFIILPILMSAQSAQRAAISRTEHDWLVENRQGCVLGIRDNEINFEEQWMHYSPTGVTVTSREHATVSIEALRTPFWAEVSYYGKGLNTYIISLRFLDQLKYDEAGHIVDE